MHSQRRHGEVIAGDDTGNDGCRCLRVLHRKNKVVVEGVNKVYKHMKPNRRNPQGGRLSKEMPIDASNVLADRSVDQPADGASAFGLLNDGRKSATARSAVAALGKIGRAKGEVVSRVACDARSCERVIMARLADKYRKKSSPLAEKAGPGERAQPAAARKRSSSTWASARRSRTRTGWSRPPSIWRRSPASGRR